MAKWKSEKRFSFFKDYSSTHDRYFTWDYNTNVDVLTIRETWSAYIPDFGRTELAGEDERHLSNEEAKALYYCLKDWIQNYHDLEREG